MDDIDRAQQREQEDRAGAIEAAAKSIPKGNPGLCYSCGEHSERLVQGACATCRDKYALP
ncbi:MAG TPA: conjugal transfer protein TraR [Gallionellaceae bacterium]|nr:conjugal transfer protein TraR [Gallionellaceae bacterium]